MAKRRNKKKQDEDTLVDIVEVRDSASDFFEENKSLVTMALVGLLILVLGFIGYRQMFQMPKQTEAMAEIAQAQFQFERDSFSLALTNPGTGYKGLLDIVEEYSGTSVGNIANYYAGVSYLNLGQFEAAADYLESFSPSGDIAPVMKYGALGDTYSELNNFDKALSMYKKAANQGDNTLLASYYLKKLGMLNEKMGNADAARDAYNELKKEYPASPYASDVDKYLIRVGS